MGNPHESCGIKTVFVDGRIEARAVGGDLGVPVQNDSVGVGQKLP